MVRFAMTAAICGAVFLCLSLAANAQDETVIMEMDAIVHTPAEVVVDQKTNEKKPCAELTFVDGKFGQAVQFAFIPNARSGFCTAWKRADASWDEAGGISFWVKGDGTNGWGGIQFIDAEDYAKRYAYCFPVDSTEWKKITVRWCDLIPELPKGDLIDVKDGYKPSGFGNIWFGKWFYWRDYPAVTYAIDRIALEKEIEAPATSVGAESPGVARFLAKLKAKKPVTIVTMGDSLSDKAHWANRQMLWSEMLVAELKQKYDAEVTLVNPAIGGTELTQNLVLMPRWLKDTPAPDLVTVCFGYNDYSSGMRGDSFKKKMAFAVDRIRRMTNGQADVLLMTTCPAFKR